MNLAAEWLFTHPEETMELEKPVLELGKMDKEEFQRQALANLNNMGRVFVFQLFQLNTAQIAEFILGLISFQPNLETKRLLYNELAYIVITTIK